MSTKAYNVTVKQTETAVRSVTASGTAQVKFRGEALIRGELRTRTVVAQGKSADLISGNLRKGTEHNLRVLFQRAPANEDGQRGGEFLAVVGIVEPKTAEAA